MVFTVRAQLLPLVGGFFFVTNAATDLLGRREGEWYREWEERIRMAVRMRFSGELTDTRVFDDEIPPELDGY